MEEKGKTAEEMAKEQREVSVSEFFERNRHLLGYDNPTRALTTVVKELVDNSLTWDTPILVKEDDRIKVVRIGEFIDERIDKNLEHVSKERNGNLEKVHVDNVSTLCFSPRTYKLEFRRISTLFRHKVNSNIYRVTLEGGRFVELTDYHSIFTLKKGKVVSIKTSELKVGDKIVVPRGQWYDYQSLSEIDLFGEMIKLPEELTKNVGIYGIKNIFEEYLKPEIRKILPKNQYRKISDFRKCDRIPFNIVRKIPHNVIKKLDNCKIGMKQNEIKLERILKVDENLAELLGLYVAEGSIPGKIKVCFSFGNDEVDLIDHTTQLIKKIFGISAHVNRAHKTAKNVTINSKFVAFILNHIFKTGNNAKGKRIPYFVFSFPQELKEKFLLAYLSGDGHPTRKIFEVVKNNGKFSEIKQEKLTVASASTLLAIDLQYLLSSLGLNYSYSENEGETRIINGIEAKFSKNHVIYIYTKQERSPIHKIPINEMIKDVFEPKLNYAINFDHQQNVFFDTAYEFANSGNATLEHDVIYFLEGDLGVLSTKKIEKIDYDKGWVYDASVPSFENFSAGSGPIMCHNSLDAGEEARILPRIWVEVKPNGPDRFRIMVKDNGPGIVDKQIPLTLGKLLYGSKFFRLRQSRGQQGIGASGSILYAQLTTGKPTTIISSTGGGKTSYYELMIDVKKNEPNIVSHKIISDGKEWHGLKIEMEIEGRFIESKQSVIEYLKQAAIGNPYAEITFEGPSGKLEFTRGANTLPSSSKEIKPHPHGIELGIFRRMLESTSSRAVASFLTNDFSRVGRSSAEEACRLAGIDPNLSPKRLTIEESEKLFKALERVKLMRPPTDCLSPLGEELVMKGLKKELRAEFFTAITRPPEVYRGNPFQIEVGIAYGGELPQEGTVEVFRLANRVPLLYQAGDCALTKSVATTDWKRYGLQQSGRSLPVGPAVILVHIASVWVPFVSESKQAIASYPAIIKEVKLALQEAGRKLQHHVSGKRKAELQQRRKEIFERYIPEVAAALGKLTKAKPEPIKNKLETMIKKKGVKELEGS